MIILSTPLGPVVVFVYQMILYNSEFQPDLQIEIVKIIACRSTYLLI